MQEAYESAASEHGHEPGPDVWCPTATPPLRCFVADDVDRAWDEIGRYLLHDARTYAEWNSGNETSAGISVRQDVEELRENSKSHRIYTVAEAVERVAAGEMLNLSPLCAGLPPELAWPYLKRVGEMVIPAGRAGRRRCERRRVGRGVDGADIEKGVSSDRHECSRPVLRPVRLRHRRRSVSQRGSGCATKRLSTTTRSTTSTPSAATRTSPENFRTFATYRSGRGTTMDIIMSGLEVPPGVILFEDPPLHDLHRRVLSRVFTPRRMEAIEPLTRQVLRARTRPAGRFGPVRLHRRISARRSRCGRSAICSASLRKATRNRSATTPIRPSA